MNICFIDHRYCSSNIGKNGCSETNPDWVISTNMDCVPKEDDGFLFTRKTMPKALVKHMLEKHDVSYEGLNDDDIEDEDDHIVGTVTDVVHLIDGKKHFVLVRMAFDYITGMSKITIKRK